MGEKANAESTPATSSQQAQYQVYDNALKALIEGREEKILPCLLKGAKYLETLNIEVLRQPLRTDRVFKVLYEDDVQILHIECEVSPKDDLDSRLHAYNAHLYHEYKKIPVITLVIYPFKTKSTAKSPLIIATRKEVLTYFCFKEMKLWEEEAISYLNQHLIEMYVLLPTMHGADADLVLQAIKEMLQYYKDNSTELGQQLNWLGIMMRRARVLSKDDKRKVQEVLDMWDQLIDEDPVIQKKIAKAEEKAAEKAKMEGAIALALSTVQGRFPALADLAKQRLSGIGRVELLTAFLIQFSQVQDEESARRLLENLKR